MDNWKREREEMDITLQAEALLKRSFATMRVPEIKEVEKIITKWMFFDAPNPLGTTYISNTLNKVLMDRYEPDKQETVPY